MQRYARGALPRETHDLVTMLRDSGGNHALFNAGTKLGKYLHHGALGLLEIEVFCSAHARQMVSSRMTVLDSARHLQPAFVCDALPRRTWQRVRLRCFRSHDEKCAGSGL